LTRCQPAKAGFSFVAAGISFRFFLFFFFVNAIRFKWLFSHNLVGF